MFISNVSKRSALNSFKSSKVANGIIAPSSSVVAASALSGTRFSSSNVASQSVATKNGSYNGYGRNVNSALAGATLAAASCVLLVLASNKNNAHSQEASDPNSILTEINKRLIRLEDVIINYANFLHNVEDVKKANPGNLMAKHFSKEYFSTLLPEMKERVYKICKSGVENPDSSMGCYAMRPDDYDVFKPLLDPIIRDYHKIPGEVHHVTNWDLESVKDKLPEGGVLDLTKLGLGTTSMRVRVGRNLAKYPLPGAMTKEDRLALERDMIESFKKLIADPSYGGTYYSITPGTEYTVTKEFYDQLVKDHIMFKDMDADSYLKSAGISADWPYGRGCYVSQDRGFIVWVGEEDHLRIMCMKKGTVLNEVFDRLKVASDVVEKYTSKFAHSKDYGYVTSCPTNLGTGMRASVHIKVPNLTSDGTETKAKAICKPLGLSVRGTGGEHTPIGADGTIDLSPSARLMITEAEIIGALYQGIKQLLVAEAEASAAKAQ